MGQRAFGRLKKKVEDRKKKNEDGKEYGGQKMKKRGDGK